MWRRLALVLGALLLCAALLEAGLRTAAHFARLRSREAARGSRTVVCVGDSHTYGLFLQEEEAYPARLRGLLRAEEPGADVVNLGVPGRNSREVSGDLPGAIARYVPVAVVVLVGVNDLWREARPPDSGIGGIFSSLRLVRAARLLLARVGSAPAGAPQEPWESVRRVEGRKGEVVLVPYSPGSPAVGEAELVRRLHANLASVARVAREGGATPLFLTYGPEDLGFAGVNDAIRSFARESGEALLDVAHHLRDVNRGAWATAYFFPDLHPRAAGCEATARLVFNELLRLGLFRGEPLADPVASPGPAAGPAEEPFARDRSNPRIRLLGGLADPDSLALEIEDVPGLPFRVLLSLRDPPPWTRPIRMEAFREDPLFGQSFVLPELAGSFDGAGRARVGLGRLARGCEAALQGKRLQVAYFVRADADDTWVRDLSGTRSFELR